MSHAERGITADEMKTLKAGIKSRYEAYHTLNRDKFPDFEYNTNRSNYNPLRTSFEEEFYVVRNYDRINSAIHIPSTNTFALLFTDKNYIPSEKILTTCRLYASEVPHPAVESDSSPITKQQTTTRKKDYLMWLLGFILVAVGSYSIYLVSQPDKKATATDLTILSPHQGEAVPRLSYITGRVANADEVWIVVHPMNEKFYLQEVAKVQTDGIWKGQLTVGSVDEPSTDWRFEVRAFVKPKGTYEAFEKHGTIVFDSWPEKADLATEPITIVRKTKITQ